MATNLVTDCNATTVEIERLCYNKGECLYMNRTKSWECNCSNPEDSWTLYCKGSMMQELNGADTIINSVRDRKDATR